MKDISSGRIFSYRIRKVNRIQRGSEVEKRKEHPEIHLYSDQDLRVHQEQRIFPCLWLQAGDPGQRVNGEKENHKERVKKGEKLENTTLAR